MSFAAHLSIDADRPIDAERMVRGVALNPRTARTRRGGGFAVGAAARRARFRAVCIERGLAAQAMSRRRGVETTFHYGVAKRDGDLAAHVWVTWQGQDVVGGSEAPDFREMAIFAPSDAANRIG